MSARRFDAPLVAALAGLALWAGLFWSGPLINDVAWQLWIGRQVNGGALLYGDILEVNPPLWFWIGAGIERLAAATGLSGVHWLGLAFVAYAAAALLVTFRLLREPRERWAAGMGLVAALFLTSPYAHLQREQFVLMSIFPYLALAARRAEGAEVSRGLALAAGLLAAPGLALKHHFLLLPALVELWLIWRRRRFDVRVEHWALAGAAMLYGAAVLLFAGNYIGTMLPLLQASYHGYNPPLWTLLLQPALTVTAFALGAALLARRLAGAFGEAAVVGAAAFAIVFLLQGKNFHYQAIPTLGLALVVLLNVLIARAGLARLVAILGLAFALLVPLKSGGSRHDRMFVQAVQGLAPGDGVAMLSASQALAWPAMYETELVYRARTMGLWMVLSPWAAEREGTGDPGMRALGTAVRQELAAEIACRRPALVVVDTRYDEDAPGGNLLNWFTAEPRFRAALASYREVPRTGYLRRFRPAGPTQAACVPEDLNAMTRALP